MKPKILEWHGCYEKSLTGFIVPEAFQHPAKFSLALIERIYDHMISRGWLKAGDVVGDPFGGVGIGGLVAAYRKLVWVGVELESKFVSLAGGNFLFHQSRLEALDAPLPVLFQGDSRKFAERVAAVVSSPPYSCGLGHGGGTSNIPHDTKGTQQAFRNGYGNSPGQIEKLREGAIASVVSSPPYADSVNSQKHGIDWSKVDRDNPNTGNRKRGSDCQHAKTLDAQQKYGATEGQIGALKAVVSSPPYAAISAGAGGLNSKPPKKPGQQGGRSAVSASQTADQKYGCTEGQISQLSATGRKETYWGAMRTVYAQCFAAIRPGGHIAIVVKDYCKGGKVVPLCDDTARLLEHVGFQVIERAHAMLVNETTEGDLFNGTQTKRRERKSFFRRLYESKGGPRIDYEEVIFACKPKNPS